MCERIVQTNPCFVVKLTHSSDGNFQQLFIAHAISIPGFGMGCRPIIAIDSSHMSRPYGGVLFLATTYDPNDCMSLLAYGIMSLKNYEDWSWFLEKLKTIFEDEEVVIISYKHPSLLWSVPEIFGDENHAYYYRHLKENFNTVVTKHNTRGNKGKECVLQCLDSTAYVRRGDNYDANLYELRNYNEVLAKWVEENSPEHWAISKSPKKRWDKMMTNIIESFNAWLKNECHHSICTFFNGTHH